MQSRGYSLLAAGAMLGAACGGWGSGPRQRGAIGAGHAADRPSVPPVYEQRRQRQKAPTKARNAR